MTAKGVEAELLIFGRCKSSDRDGRLRFYLRARLGYCDVADVADLAMLFIGGVAMPVPGGLHGKQAHGKDQGHRQQSKGYSLRHRLKTLSLPPIIVTLMRSGRKTSQAICRGLQNTQAAGAPRESSGFRVCARTAKSVLQRLEPRPAKIPGLRHTPKRYHPQGRCASRAATLYTCKTSPSRATIL